jgi:hypothetical protein
MEQTECSKTLADRIQTLEIYPEESTQRSENGRSLISRINYKVFVLMTTQSAAKITYMKYEVSTAVNVHF